MKRLLFLLFLLLVTATYSHAQVPVLGGSCPASGQNAISPAGQPMVCTGNPLVWTAVAGGGGGGFTQVPSLPAICTAGAQFYNTTLQQFIYCPATNTPVTTSGMIVQAVSAKIFLDGTVTNGSPTITSAGQANFLCPNASYPCSTVAPGSDVGLKIFATNMCNGAQCDYTNDASAVTILPSTQTKVGRIAVVNSATSVTVDCAAPGNCVSPNASASSTVGDAVVLYGPDSTAAIESAIATASGTPGCPAVIIPQGIYFFNTPVDATLAPVGTAACNNNSLVHQLPQATQYNGGGGLTILGMGTNSSVLVPTPDFTNGGAKTGCFGGGSLNQTWMNFTVSGFGQSYLGAGFDPCSDLVFMASYNVINVTFHGWGARSSPGNIGMAVTNGFNHLTNVEAFGIGGGSACDTSGGTNYFVNVTCGNSGGTSGNGALKVSNGQLISTNSTFIGGNPNNSAQIEVAAVWQSTNDQVSLDSVNSGASDDIKIDNGGIAYITNMTNVSGGVNSKGIEVVAGGKLWLAGYHHTGASPNASVTNAGTIFDGGGNTFTGTVTNTGSWLNEANSANAAVVTAAKLVLSGGWGSTAAWTALSGGNAPIQGTITNSGTGQGASPTITYTFPTPYPVAPFRCTATQTGGTNASLAPYTASALSATGVTFTATGTPTAASTEIMLITCDTP
jgi:hypothetical protein